MNVAPQLTVLMPVYNAERYLKEAIESILHQAFTDFEFLIINDGSTDRSVEIIRSFNDSRIKLIQNEKNLGVITSLNKGIELARGKYIARMDADDVSLPERLKKQFSYLESHPQVGVCGTAFRIINQKNELLSSFKFSTQTTVIEWLLYFLNPIAHPTVMMDRSLVKKMGGYSISAIHCEDYDLWVRLIGKTKIVNIDETLLYLRKHGENITITHQDDHLDNVVKISHGLISKTLNESIHTHVIKQIIFQESTNIRDTINNYRLISRLYKKYITDKGVLNSEKNLIDRDVADRFYRLARPFIFYPSSWKIFFSVIKLDPVFPLRLIKII